MQETSGTEQADVGERHPTLDDPGGQAAGLGTGRDNFGHVERREIREQLEHASFVPHPDSSRLGERELAQEAPSTVALPDAQWDGRGRWCP